VKRSLRIAGTVLAGVGILACLWAVTVWQWQDPFTALYTLAQQRRLASAFDATAATYAPTVGPSVLARERSALVRKEELAVARAARRYRVSLRRGDPVGRLIVPRLSLNTIVVNGTDHASLTKGPGRYLGSFMPGEGELVYVAGHRTTYLAPFAHIERLKPGDPITFQLPYATFFYRVRRSVIVPADDVSRLQSKGFEVLTLQACHPRFFATHRYLVYARPLRIAPKGGIPYTVRT
jgi:sortase A